MQVSDYTSGLSLSLPLALSLVQYFNPLGLLRNTTWREVGGVCTIDEYDVNLWLKWMAVALNTGAAYKAPPPLQELLPSGKGGGAVILQQQQ